MSHLIIKHLLRVLVIPFSEVATVYRVLNSVTTCVILKNGKRIVISGDFPAIVKWKLNDTVDSLTIRADFREEV